MTYPVKSAMKHPVNSPVQIKEEKKESLILQSLLNN